jgi:Uma2 family endonuclease
MSTTLQVDAEIAIPTWTELLDELVPPQGQWTEDRYLVFTDGTNWLIEFTDGFLEALPRPTDHHQAILLLLVQAFADFVKPGGCVRFSGLRMRIRKGKFREPDLLLLRDEEDPRRQNRFWTGADLALEVVSPDKPERDIVEKRGDYAEAGIPEYWIVNPLKDTLTVLGLSGAGEEYSELGTYRRGDTAASALLAGFALDVNAVFDAGRSRRHSQKEAQ